MDKEITKKTAQHKGLFVKLVISLPLRGIIADKDKGVKASFSFAYSKAQAGGA